jgi:hypothetical protein
MLINIDVFYFFNMKFPKFSLNSELNELKRFESLDQKEKSIVFYSENENSRFIFKSLIDKLINIYNCNICYITSDKDEPILNESNKKIKTFCIGDGIARTKFFLNLKADILIMTMPDLETFHIKRSKIYPVHYVYIFHAMLSTHLVYQKKAFDNFDTIFCVGNYHIEEIQSREKIYNLKPKKLIQFGYNHLDNLIEKYSKKENFLSKPKNLTQVLIAPSWGKNGLFETVVEEIIDILLAAEYVVVLRLHPMTHQKFQKKINSLNEKFSANPNFILEQNITNFNSFLKSDIMISDWSGVALEFAFTFERPVIYIDVPKKTHNPDFTDIPHIPIEVSIRDKIGIIVSPSDVKSIPRKIEELNIKSEFMKEQIKKIRDNTIFNIGKSNYIGAEQIFKILTQLNSKHHQDKLN